MIRRALVNTWADLRQAGRALRRAPGFTVVAVVTLALGIACTTAAFSVVDPVLLEGLPYRAPGQLRTIYERREPGEDRLPSYPTVSDWKRQLAADSNVIAGVAFVRGDGVTLPGPDGGTRVVAGYVAPEFFHLMGVRPFLGRIFGAEDNRPGAPAVAVISYALFMDRFGGNRAVVGTSVDMDSIPTTVIGVMPRAFSYPNWGGSYWAPTQLWQPIAAFRAAQPTVLTLQDLHADSRTIVRLAPGVDSARAAATMHVIQSRIAAAYPQDEAHWTGVALEPIEGNLFGTLPHSMFLISGAILLLLVLGCANVANLFLVRGSVRARELAVRAALGAGRGRLVRQLFAEALVIAVAAGLLGVAGAGVLVGFARHALGGLLPYGSRISLDGRAFAATAAVSALAALLVGLGPALHASHRDPMAGIRTGGVSTSGHRRERRARNLLVSLQFAVAVVLLIGSGLLIQSFRRILGVPLGYDPGGLVTAFIAPGSHAYDPPEAAAALYARILTAVDRMPGVEASTVRQAIFFTKVLDAARPADAQAPARALYNTVSGGYLKTYKIPMVAGRWYTPQDMRTPTGIVISQPLAHRMWGNASALGRRITIYGQSQMRADFGKPITLTVIGVAAGARQFGPESGNAAEVYVPYTVEPWPWINLDVRASNPGRTALALKDVVHTVEPAVQFRGGPNITPSGFDTIDAQTRFIAEVLSGFALGALLLSAIGLYGIIAYSVSQRTREIGIRIALGASRGNVLRLVAREAVVFVLVGAAAGIAGAVTGGRVLASMLFDTTTRDPGTLVAVTVALALVALAASYLPARRAARTDPTLAMRAE